MPTCPSGWYSGAPTLASFCRIRSGRTTSSGVARARDLIVVIKDRGFERLAWQDGPPVVILLCVGPASRRVLWHLLERWWPAARDASRQPGCRLVKIYPDCIEVLTAADMRRQHG